MKKILLSVLAMPLVIVIMIIVLPVIYMIDGIVLSTVWNWFMPKIFSLPALPVSAAIAVTMVWAAVKSQGKPNMNSDQRREALVNWLTGRVFLLISAFVLHQLYFN